MPRLDSIARALGISESSVSRALRNLPGVSPATAKRVQAEAERQGYRPNPYVSLMMSHMRRAEPMPYVATLAWLDSFPSAGQWRTIPAQREFYRGAQARAKELGFGIERFCAFADQMTPDRLMGVLRARGITGVLCPDPPPELRRDGNVIVDPALFAVATVGYRSEQPALNFSSNDQYLTARSGHRKLRELGYRRVGFVTKRFIEEVVEYRFSAGYYSLFAECAEVTSIPVFFADDDNPATFRDWLLETQPDGVLTTWVPQMQRFLEESGDMGTKLGWATLDWNSLQPDIAGMEQTHARVGAAAVDLVVAQLHRNELGAPINVQGSLIEGVWHDGASLVSKMAVTNSNDFPCADSTRAGVQSEG